MKRITDAVPALVAAKLAELFKDAPSAIEVRDPIRVRVRLRLDEIKSLGSLMQAGAGGLSGWQARLDRELESAIPAATRVTDSGPRDEIADAAPTSTPPTANSEFGQFVEILLRWQRSGVLGAVVASIDQPEIRAWIQALVSAASRGESRADEPAQRHEMARLAGLPDLPMRRADGASDVREAAELVEDGPDDRSEGTVAKTEAPHAADLEQALRSAPSTLSAGIPASSRPGADPAGILSRQSAAGATRVPPLLHDRRRIARGAEFQVPTVLPWLLLGQLHKLGYLRTLAAVLDGAILIKDAPVFGAAFGYKLTPSEGRAWRKSPASDRLAVAVSGLQDEIPKPAFYRLADRLSPYCPLIDGALVHATVAGRERSDPWIVHRVPLEREGGLVVRGRYSVFDPPGLFPALWAAPVAEVVSLLGDHPGGGAVVDEASADPELVDALAAANIRFFTTAHARRSDAWTRIASSVASGWNTNLNGGVDPATRRLLRGFEDDRPRLGAVVEEFGVKRVALVRDPMARLERSLALAVTVALSTLAWSLWHSRESTDAILALERFEDLDARIEFRDRVVRVVMPLGRRHRDLLDAGLLANVPDVPWLSGRAIEFSGG